MYFNNKSYKNEEDLNSLINKLSNNRYNSFNDLVKLIKSYKNNNLYNKKFKINNINYLIKTCLVPSINYVYIKDLSEIFNFLENYVYNNELILKKLIEEFLKNKEDIYNSSYLTHFNNSLASLNNRIQIDNDILEKIINNKNYYLNQNKTNKYQLISIIDNEGKTLDILNDINSDDILYYLISSKYLQFDNLTKKDINFTKKLINKDKFLFLKVIFNKTIFTNINSNTLLNLYNTFLNKDIELRDNYIYILFISKLYIKQKSIQDILKKILLFDNKNIFTSTDNIYYDIFTSIFYNKKEYIIKNIDFIKEVLNKQSNKNSIFFTDKELFDYLKHYKNKDFDNIFSNIKYIIKLCSEKSNEVSSIIKKIDNELGEKKLDYNNIK